MTIYEILLPDQAQANRGRLTALAKSQLEFGTQKCLRLIPMPFGGLLAVFTESLKYFSKSEYSKPFCVRGLPQTGIETFTQFEFLDQT